MYVNIELEKTVSISVTTNLFQNRFDKVVVDIVRYERSAKITLTAVDSFEYDIILWLYFHPENKLWIARPWVVNCYGRALTRLNFLKKTAVFKNKSEFNH